MLLPYLYHTLLPIPPYMFAIIIQIFIPSITHLLYMKREEEEMKYYEKSSY